MLLNLLYHGDNVQTSRLLVGMRYIGAPCYICCRGRLPVDLIILCHHHAAQSFLPRQNFDTTTALCMAPIVVYSIFNLKEAIKGQWVPEDKLKTFQGVQGVKVFGTGVKCDNICCYITPV